MKNPLEFALHVLIAFAIVAIIAGLVTGGFG